MAAIQGIVRGHGGAVKIYSEESRGTTIKVLLPASSHPAETRPSHGAGLELGKPLSGTVLVVDDEPEILRLARKILERQGLQVLTAQDGKLGLETFAQHADEIVLVLLDLTMPNMHGEETFRRLRQARPELPVLLMSGYNEQDATQRFVGKGLAGFISKPFQVEELLEQVRAQLT